MPTLRRPRRGLLLAWAAVLVACLLAGCSEEPVAVSEGKMPGSVPKDFPVPAGAVIGATLVDRVNHRTEVRLRVPDDPSRVARFFTVRLVESGYVVDDFGGDGSRWLIQFSRGILRGTVLAEPAGPGETSVLLSFNRS